MRINRNCGNSSNRLQDEVARREEDWFTIRIHFFVSLASRPQIIPRIIRKAFLWIAFPFYTSCVTRAWMLGQEWPNPQIRSYKMLTFVYHWSCFFTVVVDWFIIKIHPLVHEKFEGTSIPLDWIHQNPVVPTKENEESSRTAIQLLFLDNLSVIDCKHMAVVVALPFTL